MSTIAPQVTTPVRCYSFAHSLAVRARAILPIYAKTMVALARAACHLTPMKIYECCRLRIGSFAGVSKNEFPKLSNLLTRSSNIRAQCPVVAQSGHAGRSDVCPALGHRPGPAIAAHPKSDELRSISRRISIEKQRRRSTLPPRTDRGPQ
jgi:hypothetical protein